MTGRIEDYIRYRRICREKSKSGCDEETDPECEPKVVEEVLSAQPT